MFRDLAEAYDMAARGEAVSIDVRLRNRRDQAFCVRLSLQAIDALFLAAGGQGLYPRPSAATVLARRPRRRVHISLNWDSTGSMFGQYLLGLEPRGQY